MLKGTDQIEHNPNFCSAQIHRPVTFLLLQSKIPITSQGFCVEAWLATKSHS